VGHPPLLLFETLANIMVVPEKLQIKAPPRQRQKCADEKQREKNGNSNVFQLLIVGIYFVKSP
jgi:hypothetical protein